MGVLLDHMTLSVSDRTRSVEFYSSLLGFRHEPDDGPFAVMRVTDDFVILLSSGGDEFEHLAFAMEREEFDAAFDRIKSAGVGFGDRFDTVGTMTGPGRETGARGMADAVYFNDPDGHLLEIRCYER